MSYIPKPQEIYKHFKGKLYQIITLAQDSETGETLVIYQALYGDYKVYARELGMFTSKVDRDKYPNAAQEYRFELQSPESLAASNEPAACAASQPAKQEQEQVKPDPQPAKPDPQPANAGDAEELDLDPLLLDFLDTNLYEERLRILAELHPRITQDMITTMAVACDVEVEEGELEKRFSQLKSCLLMLEKYECNRLR